VGELRRDPLSGRLVAIAPGRAGRPGAGRALIEEETPEELAECPFCAGRENRTPPEVLRIGDPWQVRVVPNLYPAVDRQEVVVHSPRHVRTFADLTGEELDAVAEAWRAREGAAHAAGYGYVHALVNEGRAAGSSLPHSHSQLVWLEEEPPEVAAERTRAAAGECTLCALLASPEAVGLEVARDGPAVAIAHPAGRLPYELLVAGEHGGGDRFLAPGLRLVREAVRRLRALEGPIPWNAWLHPGGHPHLELLPRLTVMAGLELGAGIYVNTLPPEEAAARLRN
jgi:UDPglucose--hexose-1-phosphate uridylyltransferase